MVRGSQQPPLCVAKIYIGRKVYSIPRPWLNQVFNSYRRGEVEIRPSENEQNLYSLVFCEPIHDRVMAYVNVAEWKTDQVCEWLKGAKSLIPFEISRSFTRSRETE